MRLADAGDPAAGLLFDGRTAENFKLSSGTWVNVGMLRTAVIAAGAPVIEDAVMTGHDRDEIGLLIFPSLAGLPRLVPAFGRRCAARDADRRSRRCAERWSPAWRGTTRRLRAARRASRGALILTEPPSIDANEITDKGYLNQRAVLTKRALLVERLYANPATSEVIEIV